MSESLRQFIVCTLLAGVLALAGWGAAAAAADAEPASRPVAKVVVYYFHGNHRCNTCRTIEAYAEEALTQGFADLLARGTIAWRPTNFDSPDHAHFVDDYQLYASALVLVDGSDPKRYRNLERVWQLVKDKEEFLRHVREEVQAFAGL